MNTQLDVSVHEAILIDIVQVSLSMKIPGTSRMYLRFLPFFTFYLEMVAFDAVLSVRSSITAQGDMERQALNISLET